MGLSLANELRDGTNNFFLHDSITADGGYDYYLYMSITGNSYIMRRNTAGTETLYADAGFSGANWATRDSLSYDTIRVLGR